MKRFSRAFLVLKRRGITYLGYLAGGYLLPRASNRLISLLSPSWVEKLGQWSSARFSKGNLLSSQKVTKKPLSDAFINWQGYPVNPKIRQQVDAHLIDYPADEIILGHIDNDGRVLGQYGPLPETQSISAAEYVPRRRFPLDIVLLDGIILIRKDFRHDRKRFLQEWFNLSLLASHANIPHVYRVDEERNIIYKALILGRTVRDILVAAGANILSSDTDQDPSLSGLAPTERLHAVLARGTALLERCFPVSFFQQMEQQIDAMHRCGVVKLSLTFGNIIVDHQGRPWFIDLENSFALQRASGSIFRRLRDQDRQKYNRIYGREILTEATARRELKRQSTEGPGWYAPIDFGDGLSVDGFWSVDSGTGRWEYLDREIVTPLVKGKHVLDLGSNNGIMPIMMLRAGAVSVTGIELSEAFLQEARLVQQVFEWRDLQRYNLTLEKEDMLAVLEEDLSRFGVITAFCSLYYLAEEQMACVVRKAASAVPVIILQANDHTRSEAADNKSEKSSTAFLKQLLIENGFQHVDVYAPSDYSRPLLVGKRPG